MPCQPCCLFSREYCLRRYTRREAKLIRRLDSLVQKINIGNNNAIRVYYKDLDRIAKKPWKKNKKLKKKFTKLHVQLKMVQTKLLKLGVPAISLGPLMERPYVVIDLPSHLEFCRARLGKSDQLQINNWSNYKYYTKMSQLLAGWTGLYHSRYDDDMMPDLEKLPWCNPELKTN